MKYFIVTLEFDLESKPKWIENFRENYDEPFPYHVTLKMPTSVNEKNIDSLKIDLEKIVKKYKKIKIEFDKLYINEKAVNGVCIMILAKKNKVLFDLQKEISQKLSKYGKHYLPDYEKYEKDFLLHITIGRSLDKEKFKKAKNDLGSDFECRAVVDRVVLAVIEAIEPRDLIDKKNKIIYKLK